MTGQRSSVAHWLYSVRARAGIMAVVVLILAFGVLATEVREGETSAFDEAVLLMFRSAANAAVPIGPAWLPEAVRDVTALGSYSVLTLIVAAVCVSFAIQRRYGTVCFILLAVVGGTALSNALKLIFNRPRPDFPGLTHVFTSSFPSGHATVATLAYLTLGTCLSRATDNQALRRLYMLYAALLAILIGISRVYLGVHYPTDVIAGWSMGAAWALLCGMFMDARFSVLPANR